MWFNRIRIVILLAGSAYIAWVVISVPDRIALDSQCEPQGPLSALRSRIRPTEWRTVQLLALEREVQEILEWPRKKAELDKAAADAMRSVDELLQEGVVPPSSEAVRLRDLADQIDDLAFEAALAHYDSERLEFLRTCQSKLRR